MSAAVRIERHSPEGYAIKNFPSDNSKLAEMEFYLVDDLECDLTVFHPYRTLMTLCGKESVVGLAEAGELGTGIDEGPRYWGTGEGKLELPEGALQTAWYVPHDPYLRMRMACADETRRERRLIINDTYRSELCLLYPPHLIAVAALYLTLVLNANTRAIIHAQSQSHAQTQAAPHATRRSSRSSGAGQKKGAHHQDIVGFMAGLNVSMSLVATIAQEVMGLYSLWERYKEDGTDLKGFGSASRSQSGIGEQSVGGTPFSTNNADADEAQRQVMTQGMMTQIVIEMREARLADLAHPANGMPVAVNKMLERTQAAG